MTQPDKVFGDLLNDAFIFLFVFKLKDILHQIVSIRILDQIINVLNDIVCKFKLLSSGTFLETSLHDTTSVLMLANLNAVSHAGIKDELSVLAG